MLTNSVCSFWEGHACLARVSGQQGKNEIGGDVAADYTAKRGKQGDLLPNLYCNLNKPKNNFLHSAKWINGRPRKI